MADIVYADHLELRLKIRKIPYEYPKVIYENPDQKFFDKIEKTSIAIKKLKYNKKLRNMMVAYEIKGEKVEIITIHPITDEKIINRAISERWIKNE
jgi:hypothetical protein